MSLESVNESFWGWVVDTGSAGANLYLDVQADQASATGYMRYTPNGSINKPLAIAMEATLTATASEPAEKVFYPVPSNVGAYDPGYLQTKSLEFDVAVDTTDATTVLTTALDGKKILGINFIVSEEITGFGDAADRSIDIGYAADPDAYISKANGASAVTISQNVKDYYLEGAGLALHSGDLIATIVDGTDNTPDGGRIKGTVTYQEFSNLPDEA